MWLSHTDAESFMSNVFTKIVEIQINFIAIFDCSIKCIQIVASEVVDWVENLLSLVLKANNKLVKLDLLSGHGLL